MTWATAVALLAYLAVAIGLVLGVPAFRRVGYDGIFATDVAIGASFTTIGLLVARRRATPIGWLFLGVGAIEAIVAAANHFAIVTLDGPASPRPAVWAAWFAYWSVSLVVPSGLFLVLLVVFPTGRPLSRGWGWVARFGMVFAIAFAVSEILLLPRMEVTTEIEVDNPTNVWEASFPEFIWVVGLVILLGGVAAIVVRYRRSEGEERQQLRWFAFAVAAAIGSMVLLVLGYLIAGAPVPEPTWFLISATIVPLVGIGFGVPAACGVAVLRYRLWDLDVVIRKAVVAALVTATITVLYVAIVGGLGAVLGSRLDTTVAFVAAAVLAVGFQPIRERARRLADRVVYGQRATPYEVLADFSERVGGAYAADDVLPRMAQILGEGTGAERATVWLRVGDRLRPAVSWPGDGPSGSVGLAGETLPDLAEPSVEVRHRGELLGALSVRMPANDPFDPSRERLVRDLAAQAGLALRNVRLIEELRASRQRLVSAQDEERRRLERNLHDGAQQQLVALAVRARIAANLVGEDPEKEREMLADLQSGLGDALETLRDLARGIYPPLLADQGLAAALEAQARKAAVPVSVEAAGLGRYPQEVEAAVYFCTLEALNNVAKYAEATAVRVELAERDGHLEMHVADDGRGFDTGAKGFGTGLQGMADRLDAVGGSLAVTSSPGAGTTVAGRIPLPAAASDHTTVVAAPPTVERA